MARRVFFSFHFERDVWRAGQVRNCWVTKPSREEAGYIDAADWEEVKKGGDEAIKKWIREQLKGTSVTIVLIGAETSGRKYIEYEIEQSIEKGNGLLGIYIHNLKDKDGETDSKGCNPFKELDCEDVETYDWCNDDGYNNIGDWVESSAATTKKSSTSQSGGSLLKSASAVSASFPNRPITPNKPSGFANVVFREPRTFKHRTNSNS
ncbi:MAG: TIR domain-containing protein [Candidatus Omnitrophica bacterium]|nr:TIR domain-containing protein [Candidatus Omnitrophota bacterium]